MGDCLKGRLVDGHHVKSVHADPRYAVTLGAQRQILNGTRLGYVGGDPVSVVFDDKDHR